MNKRLVRIITAIIVVIALATGIFFFMNKDTQEPEIDISKVAGELDQYIPNMNEEEIKDVLDTPTTEEQDKVFNDALDIIAIPEIDSEITVDENGTAHYTDKDGDEVTIEIDQTIKDKTDEELDDDYDEMMQAIRDAASNGGTSNNSNNNSSGTQNNQNNSGSNQGNNSNNTGMSNNNSDTLTQEELSEAEQAIRDKFLKDREEAKANGATVIEGDVLTDQDIEDIGNQLIPVN